MKRRIMKLTVLLLGLVLVMAAFAGCSSKKPTAEQGSSVQGGTTNETSTDQKSSGGPEPLTLPIVKQPLTLTYFSSLDPKVSATMQSMGEMACYKELEKRTGIHINFQHPPAGQENEQFNLMLASQDLPDIIYWNWPTITGGPAKAIQDGAIIKLNDLINQYAPNLKKILDTNAEARKQSMLDDGTFYMFPFFRLDKSLRICWGPQIRKDWLDKLNLQVPKTIDDWYNVLKAFKEKDPNGNGKADELPFIASKGGGIQPLESAWGILHGFYLKNGKVAFGPAESAYKDFLATMNQWYKEGLIDPDYAATDGKAFDAKVTDNQAGAYYGLVAGNMGRYMNLMLPKDPKFELVATPYPIGPAGKPYTSSGDANKAVPNPGAALSAKNKHLKESVQWLDYQYSDEGHMLMNFGIEGESYKMVNGSPVYTDIILKNPDGLSIDQALARYATSIFASPMVQDPRYHDQILPLAQQRDAKKIWAQADLSLLMPPVTPTADESTRLASLMSEINTYVAEMFDKFVMGQEPLSNFDNYLNTLKSMGIDEAIKIEQAALDRYNAR